jgi:hypothetical protein
MLLYATCFPLAQETLMGQGFLIIEAARLHSDTPHSVELLWTSDQPGAETSTWQQSTITRDRQQCPPRDSNPQSQQALGRRPTTQTARFLSLLHSSNVIISRSYSAYCFVWDIHSSNEGQYRQRKTTLRIDAGTISSLCYNSLLYAF